MPPTDILVIGAGPAGLAFAAAAADAGLAVTVLERQPLAALEQPAEDGREIALTHRARRIMETLGLWRHIAPAEVSVLREARVLDGDSSAALRFASSAPEGESLGWLVPNHHIRAAALAAARERAGIDLRTDTAVTALHVERDRAVVTMADGACLEAALVVAADNRFSSVRRMAGIGAAMHDFGRSVVVGRIAHEKDHQGIAWECFRYGNTLALLPLNERQCSAVVTLPADQAGEWLALSDADFAERIARQAGGRLGAIRAAGPRHHYPLVGVYAHRFAAHRVALVGDAAVGMHPVTAHGWNFGLYGIEVLVRELAASRKGRRDLGALEPLQRYEREHRRTTLPVWLGTNAIVTLFTDDRTPAKLLRRAVLAVAQHAPAIGPLIRAGIVRRLTEAGAPAR